MSVMRIPAASHLLSFSFVMLKKLPRRYSRYAASGSFSDDAAKPTGEKSSWFNFFRKRWEWSVPLGVGISLLGVLQWRHLRRHPYGGDHPVVKGPVDDLMVECYRCLPLRITSRVFGWLASIPLPVGIRPTLYNFYAKSFNANLQEIDCELSTFPTLTDFFVRSLKKDARPIDPHTNIVSPSDGRVLHFGPVASCRVEQVKGVTYNLRHFLGDARAESAENLEKLTSNEYDDYVKSLLKNKANRLYQVTVYLAPGDYHRFHSPTDWRIDYRRHFQGKLLSVNPRIASWLPELFAINERVVYRGEWSGGFMAYAAVGATNVGSIKVYCDKELATNQRKWPKGKMWEDAILERAEIRKGELFGEFRMGSTIVLLFEASDNFSFDLRPGQTIKVGQALARRNFDEPENRDNGLNRAIARSVKILKCDNNRKK